MRSPRDAANCQSARNVRMAVALAATGPASQPSRDRPVSTGVAMSAPSSPSEESSLEPREEYPFDDQDEDDEEPGPRQHPGDRKLLVRGANHEPDTAASTEHFGQRLHLPCHCE